MNVCDECGSAGRCRPECSHVAPAAPRDLAAEFHRKGPGRGNYPRKPKAAPVAQPDPTWTLKWSTGRERTFLRVAVDARLPKDAIVFLDGYLAGAALRRDWAGISRREIVAFAQELRAQQVKLAGGRAA